MCVLCLPTLLTQFLLHGRTDHPRGNETETHSYPETNAPQHQHSFTGQEDLGAPFLFSLPSPPLPSPPLPSPPLPSPPLPSPPLPSSPLSLPPKQALLYLTHTHTQVRELCLKLLPSYPSTSFTTAILNTLTELAIATLVHVYEQVSHS